MAKTIVDNMEKERGTGNLELGRVGEAEPEKISETAQTDNGFEDKTPASDGFSETVVCEPESLEGINLNDSHAFQ
ncbi:hypothetical protein HN747_04270 [archaeon]|nr:hypothetical protein [archaeon]